MAGETTDRERRFEHWGGGLSLAAALIHGGLTPSHLEEWWGYGLFFFFAAAAQALFGVALLAQAINPKDWKGGDWRLAKRNFLIAGIVGNLAIVFLYIVTRTVGIPFFGPGAGETEEVGVIDVVSKTLEVALIVVLCAHLRLFLRRYPAPANRSG